MRARHRWLLWAAGLAALLLLGIAGASWWVARQLAPLMARERVEAALSSALDRPVSVGDVALSPWRGRAGLRDVRVAAGPTWESGTMLAVGRAEATVSIASVWRREVVLSRILLEDVDVRYALTGGDEPFVLPEHIPDRVQLGPLVVMVRAVEIARGHALITDPATKRTAEVDGLEVRASPADGGLDVTASAAKLRVVLGAGDAEVVDQLRADARLRGSTVTIERLGARWEGEPVEVKGTVRDVGAATSLALRVTGKLALPALSRRLGGPAATGVAALDATIQGPVTAPAFAGRFSVPALTAGPLTAQKIAGQIAWTDGRLRVSDVVARAFGGEVRGALETAPARPVESRVAVRVRDVALDAVEAVLATSYGVRGRVTGDAEVTGDLARLLDGEGRAHLESADLVLPGDAAKLGAASVTVDARLAKGVVDVTGGQVRWPHLRVDSVKGPLTAEGPRGLVAVVAGDAGQLARLWGQDRIAGQVSLTATASGRWKDPKVDGRARSAVLEVAGVKVSAVEVPFDLDGSTLRVRAAAATIGQSRVEATATLSVPSRDLAKLREDLRVEATVAAPAARLEDLDALVPADWRGRGRFSLSGRITGTLASWKAEGRVAGTALEVAGQKLDRLAARFSVDRDGLTVSEVDGRALGASLSGSGAWRWTGADASVSARARFAELQVGATSAPSGWQWTLGPVGKEATFTARGSGEVEMSAPHARVADARGVLRVDALRGTVAGEEWRAEGPVIVRRERSVNVVERLRIESRVGALAASGSVTDQLTLNLAVQGRVSLAFAAALTPEVAEAAGALEGTVQLTGSAAAPQATGSGAIRDGRVTLRRVGGVKVTAIEVPFDLDGSTLRVRGATAVVGESRVEATATLSVPSRDLAKLREDLRVEATVAAPAARLEDLDALVPADWRGRGRFSLSGRIAGTLASWKGEGRVTGTALEVAGQKLERLAARFGADPDGLTVSEVDGRALGASLSGSGAWRWTGADASVSARVRFAELQVGATSAASGWQWTLGPVGKEATFTARGSGDVEMSAPHARVADARAVLRVDALRGTVAGEEWRAEGPVIVRRERSVNVVERLRVESRVGTLAASGSVTDQLTLNLAVQGRVPLAVAAALTPEVAEAAGALEVTVQLTGSASAPQATGNGAIRDGRVAFRRFPAFPVTDLRATIAVAGPRVRLTDAAARVGGGELGASGDVVVERPAPRLDLKIRGRLPLALAAQLRPEIREVTGFAAIEATIGGTGAAPRLSGDVTVDGARLALRDYPDTLRDVRVRATLTPQALRLTDFSASLGAGQLTASGDLGWDRGTIGAYRFVAKARRVALDVGRGVQSTWDADLELGGLGSRSLLAGEARLVRGSFVSEASLLRLLTEFRGSGPAGEGPGIPLDLRVRLDDNMVVRLTIARFRAGGALSIQGTTSAPAVFGTLESHDGYIMFRRQQFTLVSAAARFSDPRRIDPLIDVQAVARIQEYDVILRLTGRAEEMEIRASSSPPLPEEDALSLIAFGKTRADLGKSGAGAVAGEVAGIVIGDLLGFGAGEGKIVDVFEVETGTDAARTVKVGKRITRKTLVVYSQGVEKSEERKLRIEYELVGPLVVAGEQDFRGGVGADVVLRFRFR